METSFAVGIKEHSPPSPAPLVLMASTPVLYSGSMGSNPIGGTIANVYAILVHMRKCTNCDKETTNPKFCSSSCSATVTNSTRDRLKNFCRHCNSKIYASKTYCDRICNDAHRRILFLTKWKETGKAAIHVGSIVRDYIFEKQDKKCLICGMLSEWNGSPIVFIMDHIDGNSQDNREENLRLICPNCDSQVPTYKAKNRGNGRHTRRTRYAEGKSY